MPDLGYGGQPAVITQIDDDAGEPFIPPLVHLGPRNAAEGGRRVRFALGVADHRAAAAEDRVVADAGRAQLCDELGPDLLMTPVVLLFLAARELEREAYALHLD